MKSMTFLRALTVTLAVVLFSSIAIHAQTTTFNYQGHLSDVSTQTGGGTYDLQFALYDAPAGGNQVGTTQTQIGVMVNRGTFTVDLDFGSQFPGANRWLEISVKKPSDSSYTTLTPRQKINSVPYAVRAISSATADSLSSACNGCVVDSQINSVSGSKVTGTVANATNAATAATATTATTATTAGTASVVSASAGDSVVSAINNAATNTTINSSRLSADVLKLTPNATQNATTRDSSAALLDATGTTVDNGNNVLGTSRFRLNADGGFYISGNSPLEQFGVVPTSGEGTRMMWYPGKYAFRAGKLDSGYSTLWDEANIGIGSFAFGANSLASGFSAIALGDRAWATNTNSIAIGNLAKAYGFNSVAIGRYSTTCQNAYCSQSGTIYNGVVSISDGCAGFTSEGLTASANNQINMRGCGGYRFFTNQSLSSGVELFPGGGSWSSLSDRNMKENFVAVDKRAILQKVLDIPVTTWNYKSQDASIRHIGVMAQDFHAAFNVGENDKHISTIDPDGVTLAAIQGLNEELKDELKIRDAKIEQQQQQINKQQQQIDALIKLVCSQNTKTEVCK